MILSINDITPVLIESIDIQARNSGNPGTTKTKWHYKDIVCAFDIETSRIKTGEHTITKYKRRDGKIVWVKENKDECVAVMYIWQFQIGKDITVIGRTWDEFNSLMTLINESLSEDERIVVYVHNLSHEFQFLRDMNILGKYIDYKNVFIMSSRKILRFTCFNEKIEFRCSYIHSNMSLDLFTEKMEVEHRKLSGVDFDYNVVRYSWTPLTEKQLEYCCNDVIGLVECIYKEMEIDGDNLYTIPLTSTGYVRRDIRKAIHDNLPSTYIKERKTDYETFKILRDAFRGGNTHANRYIADKRIDGKISEYDRSSSYPDVQLNGLFPIGKFHKHKNNTSRDAFMECINKGYCVIARLHIEKIRLRDELTTVPYLSSSNCQILSKNNVLDNGRILSADIIEIAITEVDLNIILNQYEWDYYEVIDFRFAQKGEIPDCIKDVIRHYYKLKTELKGDELNAIIYMKSKNKLNAIYGNSAQSPCKMNFLYTKDGEYCCGFRSKHGQEMILDETKSIQEIEKQSAEILESIYEESNTVLPYQWGVYTTALARAELQKMIDICSDNFLYCDTDSVYFLDDGTISFDEYNKEKIELSTKSKAFATDRKGKVHYMGVAECERSDITSFKTLGAKKYAYITKSNELKITISGVSKKFSSSEVMKEYANGIYTSPLDVIETGFQFVEAGGNELVYNDYSIESLEIDGHSVYIPYNVVIQPSTYEIGLGLGKDGDYVSLLIALLNSPISIFYEEKFGIPIDYQRIL